MTFLRTTHIYLICLSFSSSSGMKRLPYSEDEFGSPPNKLARVDEPKRGVQCFYTVLSTFYVCAPIFCTKSCLHGRSVKSVQKGECLFGNRLCLSPWYSLIGTLLQGASLPKTTPVSSSNHTLASSSLVYFYGQHVGLFLFFLFSLPSVQNSGGMLSTHEQTHICVSYNLWPTIERSVNVHVAVAWWICVFGLALHQNQHCCVYFPALIRCTVLCAPYCILYFAHSNSHSITLHDAPPTGSRKLMWVWWFGQHP